MLAAQHLLELRRLDHRLEGGERALELLFDVLPRLQPLQEDEGVVLLPLQASQEVAVGLDPLAALQDLLGRLLVLPEVGPRHLLLEAGELALQLVLLKDSRGCPAALATS